MELDVKQVAEKLLVEMVKEADSNYYRMEGVRMLFERLQLEAKRVLEAQQTGENNDDHTAVSQDTNTEEERT